MSLTLQIWHAVMAIQSLHSPQVLSIAKAVTGGIAAAATTPLDVVKTRLQLEGVQAASRHTGASVVRPWDRAHPRAGCGLRAMCCGHCM